MLPEVMPYDPTRPARFPDNGRTLTDDAVDVFLTILTNGKVTGDKVGAAPRSARRIPLPRATPQMR